MNNDGYWPTAADYRSAMIKISPHVLQANLDDLCNDLSNIIHDGAADLQDELVLRLLALGGGMFRINKKVAGMNYAPDNNSNFYTCEDTEAGYNLESG